MKHVDWTPSLIGTDIQIDSNVIVRQIFGLRALKSNYFQDQAGTNVTLTRNALGTIINSSGGGGSVSFTAATITTSFGLQFATVNVVDAAIGVGSKVQISWGMIAQTDENTPDMDDVRFDATPLAGSMDVLVSSCSMNQPVGGAYKIMYLVG